MKPHEGYKFSDKDLAGYAGYLCHSINPDDLNDKNILDVGCGFGWFERFAVNFKIQKITGIEPTENELVVARQNNTGALDKVHFKTASVLDLKKLNESYDTVICWEVLEHIPPNQEKAFFQNISHVLKPGGHFYFSTPHASLISNLTDPAWFFGHRHYKSQDIINYAQAAGLTVKSVQVLGAWHMIAYTWNLYFSKWVLRRAPLFQDRFLKKMEDELHSKKGFCCNVIKFSKTPA